MGEFQASSAYEAELKAKARLFQDTNYFNNTNEPIAYTPDELDTLSWALLSVEQLALTCGGNNHEEQRQRWSLLGDVLKSALTNGNSNTSLGEYPRAEIANILGYDIVSAYLNREKQSPTTTEEILLLELVVAQRKLAQIHEQLRNVSEATALATKDLLFQRQRRQAAEERIAQAIPSRSVCRATAG